MRANGTMELYALYTPMLERVVKKGNKKNSASAPSAVPSMQQNSNEGDLQENLVENDNKNDQMQTNVNNEQMSNDKVPDVMFNSNVIECEKASSINKPESLTTKQDQKIGNDQF